MSLRLSTVAVAAVLALTAMPSLALAERSTPGQLEARTILELMPAKEKLTVTTPPGPKDNYHFEVFALDTTIPAEASADFDLLIASMKGHILASGEVVGLGERDPNAPPPAPKPAG